MKKTIYTVIVCILFQTTAGAAANDLKAESSVYQGGIEQKSVEIIKPTAVMELRYGENLPRKIERKNRQNGEIQAKSPQVGAAISAPEEWNEQLRQLNWQMLDEEMAEAFVEFQVNQAPAYSIGLYWAPVPENASIQFYDPQNGTVISRVTAATERENGLFFSELNEGNRIGMRILAPYAEREHFNLRIEVISYLYHDIKHTLKDTAEIGKSKSCNIDINCASGANGNAIKKIRSAVAKIIYRDTNNSYYLCTGQLINTLEKQNDVYMLTAGHCLGQQTKQLPANFYWNFESQACYSSKAKNFQVTQGGASILSYQYNGNPAEGRDFALLRLNQLPPIDTVLLGWNAGKIPSAYTLYGIHHPAGDLKKYAFGENLGLQKFPRENFVMTRWLQGLTEGGSSGSGLYAIENGEAYLYGILSGGTDATCYSSNNHDYYTSLISIFPEIQPYIGKNTGSAYSFNGSFSGSWYNPQRDGEGLVLEVTDNAVLAYWYTYNTSGQQLYLVGSVPFSQGGNQINIPLYSTDGTVFGNGFRKENVRRLPWGNITLSIQDCKHINLSYQSSNPNYGGGNIQLERLTSIEGRACQ